ncbi:hypothetical protein CVIRNUC_006941 [Coccomyxa viridis]|uniref:Uncharacterized protein n=1 Tax=Coccomyxa viridis TaxID=1274662 RepID=A0AAV1IAM9_9CHLO|nr:hypothetical protein CVIRNUC_006941 [Coccomyxa viridis]
MEQDQGQSLPPGISSAQYAAPDMQAQPMPVQEGPFALGLAADAGRASNIAWTTIPPMHPLSGPLVQMFKDGEYKTGKNGSGPGNGNGGSNNSSNGAGSQGQPAAQSQPTQMADVQQQAIGDVESFSLVVGPSGEVTHCASGGLRNVKNYPHFNQACKYLVHMVQLDAAAMNLKRRFEDPNITASLEAQQAYTRALAPGGQEMVQAPPQMTVLASQAMPYPLTFQPQPGAPPGQLMPSADYADLGGGGLLSGASAQDKNLAFSKVVRKAYRTVFKRIIRPLLNRNFSNQLPLCTSNHCIVLPVGMEDMNQFSATTPPDSKDPNAPWYHMNVNGTDAVGGPEAATPQAQFAGQLSPEGTPPGPIGAVQAAQAAQQQQQAALGKPKCQAGGDCARTRAALNWPDHLPCVDPSKVSVPVDKSIALLKWFESLGHSVPELRELEAIKRSGRCRTMQDNPTRNVKPRVASPEGQSDRDAAAGLAALRSAAASHDDSDPDPEQE